MKTKTLNTEVLGTLVLAKEVVTVGQAKQRLVAAIYRVAKRLTFFSVGDVWAEVNDPAFRRLCADRRLIAAALLIAQRDRTRYITKRDNAGFSDAVGHEAPRARWQSLVCK